MNVQPRELIHWLVVALSLLVAAGTVDAANIFNSKQEWYSGSYSDRITDRRDHGVRFQAGVNGSF